VVALSLFVLPETRVTVYSDDIGDTCARPPTCPIRRSPPTPLTVLAASSSAARALVCSASQLQYVTTAPEDYCASESASFDTYDLVNAGSYSL
jgi:hypothetical protein